MLMVMLPGPPPNTPISKNLDVAHTKMKAVTPKLQLPKIGKVEIERSDILIRAKQHAPFTGSNENHIIFSMEKRGCMHKATMAHLRGGDIYFNRWPLPGIPFPQLMKVTQATADNMFTDKECQVVADGESDCENNGATSDELALDKDMAIPYPQEHHMQLGMELIHVFGADVVVLTEVGSGEMMQAVLQKHKFGVGFCSTPTQKKQVMIKLKNFAKLMNLVSLNDGPGKSEELLMYEKSLQPKTGLQGGSPADPGTPKAGPPGVPPTTPKAGDAATPNATTPKSIQSPPPMLAGFGGSLL